MDPEGRPWERQGQEGSNGAGHPSEHITNLLVFSFLKHCAHCNFRDELELLGRELPTAAFLEQAEDLQTDGNRSSHFHLEGIAADSDSQDEVIHNIAVRLAQMGDEMESSVQPGLVQNLVMHFRNANLSEEDRRCHLAAALDQVMQAFPRDMEVEKTKLMLAMLLAKKVADHTPSLLCDVFRTAVNFINQDLLAYVRNLARNEVD
ncbi:BH3-interacting domain death agonist [Echinops telfairi]|uniref:BH3-interacting domain death agonist n=2 Tax=Echinops telfairi TaxID=9371 RepID=A0AC55DJC3_ECHTE|nr:BH3-interacting domain death agonist [Echinops telfairi]XP_045151843.1 BH3-interacting domain death agonist [Echinops telfairi]